jgi:hypothetical protein
LNLSNCFANHIIPSKMLVKQFKTMDKLQT